MRRVIFLASCLAAVAASAQTYTWTTTILYTPTPAFAYCATFGRQFGSIKVGPDERAAGWRGTAASLVQMNPDNADESRVSGAFGNYEAGWMDLSGTDHAIVWTGYANSVVDLNGSFRASRASSVSADGIGGWAYLDVAPGQPRTHAILWRGSATNYVDLTPDDASALCLGAADGSQVGILSPGPLRRHQHPCVWYSTAASVVDLAPDAFIGRANAADGNTQVGVVNSKACLWHGSAKSKVSLHPGSALVSEARGVKGGYQVGWATFRDPDYNVDAHAVIWTGSADSYLDLHQYLPPEYESSEAYGISTFATRIRDKNSTKMYARFEINVVGYALRPGGQGADAVMWRLVGSTSEVKLPTVPIRIKKPHGTIRRFVVDLSIKMKEEIPRWKISQR